MADIITTLHPENTPNDNLYPNIKMENIPNNIVNIFKSFLDTNSNLNLIKDNTTYILLSGRTYDNIPENITSLAILRTEYINGNNSIQIIEYYKGNTYRRYYSNTWGAWELISTKNYTIDLKNSNINNTMKHGTYLVTSATMGEFPEIVNQYALLYVDYASGTSIQQIISYYNGNIYRRFYQSGIWGVWSKIYDSRYPNLYKYPYIYNNKVMCNKGNNNVTAYYAGVDCGDGVKIDVISARYIWNKAKTGQESGTVALISNPNGADYIKNITDLSLHLILTNSKIKVDVLGGKFGSYYYQNLINSNLTTIQELDGITEHTVTLAVTSNLRVYVYIDNVESYTGVLTPDTNISSLYDVIGQYAIFEHYCLGDMNNYAMPMFTYWTCRQGSTTFVYDYFDREDGQLTNTPQGLPYHLFTTSHNIG